MTGGEARTRLVNALVSAGLRVAQRPSELTPPCLYVERWGTADNEIVLLGGVRSTFALYWVPVRGVDDPAGDDVALDAVLAALSPIVMAPLDMTRSTFTVNEVSWPCHRGEAVLY